MKKVQLHERSSLHVNDADEMTLLHERNNVTNSGDRIVLYELCIGSPVNCT
jgi:hypothetical protein